MKVRAALILALVFAVLLVAPLAGAGAAGDFATSRGRLQAYVNPTEPWREGKDMNARSHGSQRASRRPIGREQAPRTIGAVARTVQEAIDTGEAISVGAVSLVKNTALAAFSGAREVGAEAGSAAVAAVRGSIAAAREIGGDLGRMSGRVLHGTFGAAQGIGNDLMNLVNTGGARRPLAKATSQRRRRTSERERTTRRSA